MASCCHVSEDLSKVRPLAKMTLPKLVYTHMYITEMWSISLDGLTIESKEKTIIPNHVFVYDYDSNPDLVVD